MYLDLSEVGELFHNHRLWSSDGAALAWFRRRDHLGSPSQSLAESVQELVVSRGKPRPQGPIRLLTHLRYYGFFMNPVSFYYCFDEEDKRVETIVAEVNNTPWGERHCYVLDMADFHAGDDGEGIEKEFHVSPFMPMDVHYRWQMSEPGETLAADIRNYQNQSCFFQVEMELQRVAITSKSLKRVLIRHPHMTAKVFAGIYFQALRLWWKGCPFYPHPKRASTKEEHTFVSVERKTKSVSEMT